MRRFCILLTFVFIVCLAHTSEARKRALLIGVDDYTSVPKLKCCVNDMNTLKEALMKIGFEEDDIQMLVTGVNEFDKLPTKKNIERSISKFVTDAQPSDFVFLALSGHGAQEGKNVYFCPPEVEMKDIPGTCVSINRIMDILSNNCHAKFKWMVVDACRNDPTQASKGIGGKGLQVIPTPPAGIALFQSCAEGEESWEDRVSGNGYFTKNFAAALSGEADANRDGNLTLMEVCTWTTAETRKQVRDSQNKSQRPYFSGSVSDFTLTENGVTHKIKELVEEGRKAMDDENYELALKKLREALELNPQDRSISREINIVERLLKIKPPIVTPPETIVTPPAPTQSGTLSENEPLISLVQKPTAPFKEGDRMVYKIKGVEFAFRWCPPGTFMMGSPRSEKGRRDNNLSNETQHKVILTKGFWMMETEVSQIQWKAVMGYSPNCRFRDDNLPVESVSWDACQQFCQKCTEIGLPVQLPTEAQWEYACRAGIMDAYAGNLEEMAWFNERLRKTHPVGMKTPNQWGLYDMHGNVWEWCQDWKGQYTNYVATDPTGPSSGSFHVYRGGGYESNAYDCRSATRNLHDQGMRNSDAVGFRCISVQ